MNRFLLAVLLLAAGGVAGKATGGSIPPPDADVATAVRQFRAYYHGNDDAFALRDSNEPAPDPARARHDAQTLRQDGSWADLDYHSTAHSGWPPETHCTRLTAMAAAAGNPALPPADRAMLLEASHRAFGFWIAHDFQCPNWWYNEIGTPKAIGLIALLLGDQLAPAEFHYAADTSLARFPIARTGQNRVWLAGNTLMRGLLVGDPALIRTATDVIWHEVAATTAEGIQPDFSFHQHGPQPQFGNYGLAFAVETARWAHLLRGTRWQLPAARLAVFRHYLLDGLNWVSWRGVMDISACDRQLMPRSPRSKAVTVAGVMAQAAGFDPAEAAAYLAFVARNRPNAPNDLVGDRYFWRSDYLIHRRPGFMASLKLSSNRVIGTEMVNHENLSGYHLADGVLYLYRDGDEYRDIFPVWDWRQLPGVTCAQGDLPEFKTSSVQRDFVGAVSDGTDACAALDYVRDGVSAKKAWFFAGDTIVCLGANISGPASAPVATTLNQCRWRGPVLVRSGGHAESVATGSRTFPRVDDVEHDGWRYTLLEPGEVHLETGPVTGNWSRVFTNPETPPADVTEPVFKLWLDHGRQPQGAHYAYAVAPVGTTAPVRVLENSAERQAVLLPGAKVGIVFWQAGIMRLPDGRTVAVDQPCLVLAGPDRTLVTDPTQKLTRLHLRIGATDREVILPRGPRAGTSALVD